MALSFARPWMAMFFGFAALWIVPAAFLLAFGDRPEPPEVAPVTRFVSATTGEPCVMFCEEPLPTAPVSPLPSTDNGLCPPFCAFEEW